ncbi:MAG: methyltransferase domain-containing protein [Candidatus Aenigmarchaeota archaeon]|nr:methyltransferase domain-containing protein [Candidatus Aenigmarchaeota archaeon]
MKPGVLDILICPDCSGGLLAEAFSKDENEMENGILSCRKCGMHFPVISGIPRMLPPGMINDSLMARFLDEYGDRVPKGMLGTGGKAPGELKRKTSESFGFQWNAFPVIRKEHEQTFLNYIAPLKPSFFRHKLVLDAGCGFGRHTYFSAKWGAEVVGFDLSDAVEAAYRNCGRMPGVHIVQGDIYNLPFRRKFDFIMSIGVIHHLPKPKQGFMRLVGLARKDSDLFVWLYGREGRWFKIHVVEGIIRRATTRMPHRLLYYLCYVPASIYHFTNMVYNFLNGHGASGIARYLPFKDWAKFAFKSKHQDAFDLLATPVNNYYTREEVLRWGRDARLRDIKVTSLDGKSWRLFGKK